LKVLVADDHGLVREGIKLTLKKLADDLVVVEATTGDEVRAQLAVHPDVDLVLLDLFMPQTDGFGLLASLSKSYPELPIVMLSASEEAQHMRKAIDWGSSGYIPKSFTEDQMIAAIEEVLQGGVFVPSDTFAANRAYHAGNQVSHDIRLTSRQEQVLALLGEGRTNKEIANNLGLSEYTIKIHVTAILKLLGATNRTQAVIEAKRLGLLTADI